MDPKTGRIIEVDLGEVLPVGYIWIPKHLQVEAEELLETAHDQVDFDGHGPLSQWARDQRAAVKKRKARRRRNNRQARRAKRQGR